MNGQTKLEKAQDCNYNKEQKETYTMNQSTDIFLWANNNDEVKKELDVELFLFNKNYTLYSVRTSTELDIQLRALFLYELIGQIILGAGTGLAVCDYESADNDDNSIFRADISKVGRAETLIHLIENERRDIVEFNEEEHELKRAKGIIARFSNKNKPNKEFYVFKLINQSSVFSGASTWEINDGKFQNFTADAGLKIASDNQVLIIASDIFVFNQSKFERLFNYNYKKQMIADQKVSEIEKHFRLSFPDGMSLQSLVNDHKGIFSKIQKLEISEITQDQIVEKADSMNLELMSDDSGAIIIMSNQDLSTFINIINDDYMLSDVTGNHYEIKNKKLLDR